MPATGNFTLHGGNDTFLNRQKALVSQLLVAEKECNKNKMETESAAKSTANTESNLLVDKLPYSRLRQIRKSETKRFRGKTSIFKRPEGPAPRSSIRSIPDYHRNPHKWTKYTLEDVSNEDMTERSNARAALSFLNELRARKEMERKNEEDKMDINETNTNEQASVAFKSLKIKSSAKIQFKKPETEQIEDTVIDSDDKPVFRNTKIIMPEYVVGQKQKRKNRNKPRVKVDHSKELRLDHLHESDEEQEDEN